MKTVIWLCVCEVTVKTDCKVSLASPPRFFCLRGHTHQTGLARSVLSLSSALNGCWSLMWLGCCYCLWHVLISVYWSGKSGHENNWSRPMGRREPIVAESRFKWLHLTLLHVWQIFRFTFWLKNKQKHEASQNNGGSRKVSQTETQSVENEFAAIKKVTKVNLAFILIWLPGNRKRKERTWLWWIKGWVTVENRQRQNWFNSGFQLNLESWISYLDRTADFALTPKSVFYHYLWALHCLKKTS